MAAVLVAGAGASPHSLVVEEGGRAVLDCGAGSGATACLWTRDGFLLGTEAGLPAYPRYSVQQAGRDCQLVIEPVVPLDEGEYSCQVAGSSSAAPPRAGPPTTLAVNCPPGRPHILQGVTGDPVWLESGAAAELRCQSQGGRPPAEIQWWDATTGARILGDSQAEVSLEEFATKMQDKKTWLTVSILKFKPEKSMILKCTVFNDAFPTPKQSEPIQIKIRGQIAPKLVKFSGKNALELKCDEGRDANPKKFKWIINGQEIPNETESSLKILQINESYHNTEVRCLAAGHHTDPLTLFRLLHTADSTELARAVEPALPPQLAPRRTARPGRNPGGNSSGRTVFTCVAEEEAAGPAGPPEFVWIEGALERRVTAVDTAAGQGRYKCRLVRGGYEKLRQMAGSARGISRKIRRFTKTLNQLTDLFDDT